MGKLSPEVVNGLKERGVSLTDEEVTSVNTILRNAPQELSMEDLDQAVGGIGWKECAKAGLGAAVIVAAAVGIDFAQAYGRKATNDEHVEGKMMTPTAIQELRKTGKKIKSSGKQLIEKARDVLKKNTSKE